MPFSVSLLWYQADQNAKLNMCRISAQKWGKMEAYIVQESKKKALRLVYSGLFMFLASLALLLFGVFENRIIYIVIGAVATLFFGISFFFACVRALRPKPLLTITEEGIFDTSTAVAVGFIAFSQIQTVSQINIAGQKALGIRLKDCEAFLNTLPKSKQQAIRTNQKLNLPPITIRLDTSAFASLAEIAEKIATHINHKEDFK